MALLVGQDVLQQLAGHAGDGAAAPAVVWAHRGQQLAAVIVLGRAAAEAVGVAELHFSSTAVPTP